MTTSTALEILREFCIGSFINRISIGDTFVLSIEGIFIIAHNIESSDELQLNNYLREHYPPFESAIDKEHIAKNIVLSALARQIIEDVDLSPNGDLTLTFETGQTLLFPTNCDIVDWQWAVCENANCPYNEFIVACFFSGSVQTSENALKSFNRTAIEND